MAELNYWELCFGLSGLQYSSTDHDGSFEVTDDGVGESNDNDEESDGEDEGTLAAGSHDEYALIHHMQTQLNVTHGNSSGSDDEDTNGLCHSVTMVTRLLPVCCVTKW